MSDSDANVEWMWEKGKLIKLRINVENYVTGVKAPGKPSFALMISR